MVQIEKIKIDSNPIFENKVIDFKVFNDVKNTYTLIIGQNGCGKSELLRIITDSTNSQIIEKESNGRVSVATDGCVVFKDSFLPKKVIASSFSLNDKFPILTSRNKLFHKNYEYLGIRSTTNNAFIGKYKKEFLSKLTKILSDKKRTDSFKSALVMLDMPTIFKFSFKYGKGMRDVINSLSDVDSYDDFSKDVNQYIEKNSNSQRLNAKKYFDKLNSSYFKNNIFEFFSNKNLNSLEYEIDLSNPSLNELFLEDSTILNELVSSNVIKINDFSFVTDMNYSFSVASSGQYHIFTEILNISSSVIDFSIILIDEPEISLHPNWQVQYIEILQNILDDYTGCQVIICSHSHFLVSNIDSNFCSVMKAKKDNYNNVNVKIYEQDVYGWSPEQVLYNVFGMTSTRNHYFEADLKKVVSIISKVNLNIDEIHEPLNRLKLFNITDDDPLKILIEKADNFISEANDVSA
ncbi:AAA family ATPase [Photobacterium leiognathi]|uniref:AAA family ATPase n=1 Tax=Photobacterium leiognathi TaxID=553611 RepID=UPI0029814807|nr:AAA family ATPase [Photobacterium leiognathi]